ncbi:rhomboid family intramembrane serine protease [Gracilinema caldarium]|uniref:rhomboid family intramembrane serine protease n=1 Tax=Gracilinema caldarium TaxID=215591 RepID=UPI0026EEFACC|nr:rhomboid family intramembrane serine protease [Gracilinema caldarium]
MNTIIRKPFRYRYDNLVLILIGINLLVFLAQNLFPEATVYLSLNTQLVLRYGMVWQFLTYMFAHGGISHLLLNMLGLFFFGTPVERQMGSKEFLLFYLVTGFFAGLFSFGLFLLTGSASVFLLGASGALFAVQLAYATFFPDSIVYLWGILPLRAPVMVLGFTALELFFSVTGIASGVAHFTHLAGFAFAWLYFIIRYGENPWHYLKIRR